MTVVGFHASHEQMHPPPAGRGTRAEEAGFDAAMCSDHFAPWSERQGHSGFAWSWLGAALAGDGAALRRRQRARASATTRRSSPRRSATLRRDVPRPVLGGARHRRGLQRAHHRRPLAAQGRAQRPAARVRRRHPRACSPGEEVSHDGLVTVDRARIWTLPGRAAAAVGAAVSAETAGWVAGWADGLITVDQPPDALRQVVDAYRDGRRQRAAASSRCTCRYAPTRTRRCAIAHDQWRTNVFAPPVCWDLELRRALRRSAGERVAPEDVRDSGARLRPTRREHARLAARAGRPRLRRDLPAPRRPGARTASSTSSASEVLPQLDGDRWP